MRKIAFGFLFLLLPFLYFSGNNFAFGEDATNCSLCHGQTVSNFALGKVDKDHDCLVCHKQLGTPDSPWGGGLHGSESPVFKDDKLPLNFPTGIPDYSNGALWIGGFRMVNGFDPSDPATWRKYSSVLAVPTDPPDASYNGPTIHNNHLTTFGYTYFGDPVPCQSCHGINYRYTTVLNRVDCEACHKNAAQVNHKNHGTSDPNNFTDLQTFNLQNGLTSNPGTKNCTTANCHSVGQYQTTGMRYIKTQRDDGKQLCVNCHNASRDGYEIDKNGHGNISTFHNSTFVAGSDLDCNSCHQGSGNISGFHNGLGVTAKNNILYDFTSNNCTACHSNNLTPKGDKKLNDIIISANKTADAGKTNCNNCHQMHFTNRADADTNHNSGLDSRCLNCHAGSLTADHITNRPDKGYTCNTCHSIDARSEVKRTIAAGKVSCSGCHKKVHNLNATDKVPVDIPLFTGSQWTSPYEASLFNGERTTPAGYDSAQVVFSNRRTDINLDQVWSFYYNQLTAGGWTLKGSAPAAGTQNFTAEFAKNIRVVTVKCYSAKASDGLLPYGTGFKIEVWYK